MRRISGRRKSIPRPVIMSKQRIDKWSVRSVCVGGGGGGGGGADQRALYGCLSVGTTSARRVHKKRLDLLAAARAHVAAYAVAVAVAVATLYLCASTTTLMW